MPAASASIAFDDKDGFTSPAAVLPDPPGRLAMPVDVLDKVEILPLKDVFRGSRLFRPAEVKQAIKGHNKQLANLG